MHIATLKIHLNPCLIDWDVKFKHLRFPHVSIKWISNTHRARFTPHIFRIWYFKQSLYCPSVAYAWEPIRWCDRSWCLLISPSFNFISFSVKPRCFISLFHHILVFCIHVLSHPRIVPRALNSIVSLPFDLAPRLLHCSARFTVIIVLHFVPLSSLGFDRFLVGLRVMLVARGTAAMTGCLVIDWRDLFSLGLFNSNWIVVSKGKINEVAMGSPFGPMLFEIRLAKVDYNIMKPFVICVPLRRRPWWILRGNQWLQQTQSALSVQ